MHIDRHRPHGPSHSSLKALSNALLTAALFCLGGCSLLSVNLKPAPDSACNLANPNPIASNCTTDEALKYASKWRELHLKAAGQHSIARNLNAILGLPAGAVAAFYGISGHGSTDRITRLTLGSATLFGATSFLAPQGKQRAYLEGALALSCVMDATTKAQRAPEDVARLRPAMELVIHDHDALDSLLRSNQAQLGSQSMVLARAAVVRDNAENLLVRAGALRRQLENLGLRSAIATDRIVTQTAMLASQHESDLSSLLATAAALRTTAGSFSLPSSPKLAPAAAESTRARDVGLLETATNRLEKSTSALLVLVRSLELQTAEVPSYELCALGSVTSDFSVAPAEPAQSVAVGNTLDFQITNTQSNAFPSYATSGAKADSIDVDGPLVKNGRLVIVVKGKAATGAEAVGFTITDPSGGVAKAYRITVLPAPDTKSATATNDNPTLTTPKGYAGAFSTAEIKHLQCRLGLTGRENSGVVDDNTYRALLGLATSRRVAMGPSLSQRLFDEAMKLPDTCEGAV